MDLNNFFQSKTLKIVLVALGALVIVLLIFEAGVFVGYRKANFSFRWAENYHRNFAGPRSGFFGDLSNRNFISSHGVSGSVMKIDGSVLIIKGRDNVEKTVLVSGKTVITSRRDTIKVNDLKIDDQVVIIGSPTEDGQIEAKFIRIMPK